MCQASGAVFYLDTIKGTWRGVLFCVTHSGFGPLLRESVSYLCSSLKSYFLYSTVMYFSPIRGPNPECVRQLARCFILEDRYVARCFILTQIPIGDGDSSVCRASGAVFYSDCKVCGGWFILTLGHHVRCFNLCDTLCIFTPIGKSSLIFLSVLKSYFFDFWTLDFSLYRCGNTQGVNNLRVFLFWH